MAYKIKIKSIGKDYWGRETYRNIKNGNVYKEVEGELFTTTKEGEPFVHLKKDIEVIKQK